MKIKIIPNVLSREGRSEFIPEWVRGKTVREYLRERNIKTKGMRVIVSGRRIKKLSVTVKKTDEIIITPVLKDPISISLAIGWALTASLTASLPISTMIAVAYTVGAIVLAGVVGIATLAIVSAFSSPKKPSYGSTSASGGLDSNSPTYGWDGVQTTQNVGTPIGIVYGEHKVGGNVINQFITNDGDKNYLHTLLALSEGEIESISDIKINDNPIANFEGITTAQVLGTNTQAPITGFEDLHDVKTVGVVLNDLNDDHTYTMSDSDIVGFEVLLTFPAGIYSMNNQGSVGANSVQFKIEYKLHSSGTWTTLSTYTLSESNRSSVRRIYRKTGLTAGNYDIKVTRLTAASTVTEISDMTWTHVDELRDDSLSYPNTALLAVNYLATDQLSGGTPNLTCVVKGKKIMVPDIRVSLGGAAVAWDNYYYDPISEKYKLLTGDTELYWDEATYVFAYSANPVWVVYDLLTNKRYGIGEFIDTSHIDLASFLEMSQYCDGKVSDGVSGYEKRFRMDCVIDSESRSLDVLMQLAATFRAIFFFSENAIKLKIDKPDLSVQMFTMGNIVADTFTQKWKSTKEFPNVVQIQFLDKDKDYEQEIISYVDEEAISRGDVLRKKDIRLFCTRVTQAIREARYFINFSKYVDRSITFKAGIDAIACQVGDVIDFCHDVPQWGYSGRVVSAASTSSVTLDRVVTILAGQTFKLKIRHSDDTIEERSITNIPGNASVITVSPAFSFTPSKYDVYSVGEESVVTKPFRIMSIQREANNEVLISAVEYNGTVYDDSGPVLPTSNYSSLPTGKSITNVSNLTLIESTVRASDGTVVTSLDAWWNKPDDTATTAFDYQSEKAKVYVSIDERASWQYAGSTDGNHFQFPNVTVGQKYYVSVVSVARNGTQNPVATSPYSFTTVVGKSVPASTVSSFLANQFRDKMVFGWTEVNDKDLGGYEIRLGATWDSGYVVGNGLTGGSYTYNDLKVGANQSFWIKAYDRTGNYSTAATEAVVTVEEIPFTNIVSSFSEQTSWSGTKSDCSKVGNNLEINTGLFTGVYVTPVRDCGYVASFRIGISTIIVGASDATLQDFGEATLQDSDTLRLNGTEISAAADFRIKTSEDNITWSDWSAWQSADYRCRYFQIEMTITRSDLSVDMECSNFDYYADLPDVDEFGEGTVSAAANGATISFAKNFHEAPAVHVSILSGTGYVYKFTSNPTTTGFTVKLYQLDGTAVVGDFSYQAHGI